MSNTVAILGCGPAGLMAAHGIKTAGGNPVIISRMEKSELPGAQYLHAPIPRYCEWTKPDGVIRTLRRGTAEGYAQKVYGDPAAPTSWAVAPEEQPAWDLRRTYDRLWDDYEDLITPHEIEQDEIEEFTRVFPLVISTIPGFIICQEPTEGNGRGGHRFDWEPMYVVDWAPPELEDNTVLYSGDPAHDWYRSSKVFGHVSTEATQYCFNDGNGSENVLPIKRGQKVKGTNCDCRPEVKRAGRYGAWRKGYLTHHAFHDAVQFYMEAFEGGDWD